LSVVMPRQRRLWSMLLAMLLYMLFFLIQTSIKANGGKGKLDPVSWRWAVNLIYLALAIGLNLWDTVPVRSLRARFLRKGAV
ncbi:LptF/LptG family permease, partial [Salmonella enterica]|uniref:LptF/LptG family permease n=1 Tax=Salmonella enterica TaxID=28901 RepID=UPI00398C2A32